MALIYMIGVKAKILSDWLTRTEINAIRMQPARTPSPAIGLETVKGG